MLNLHKTVNFASGQQKLKGGFSGNPKVGYSVHSRDGYNKTTYSYSLNGIITQQSFLLL